MKGLLAILLIITLLLSGCTQTLQEETSEADPTDTKPAVTTPENGTCVIRVSPDGDDAADGINAPVRTVARALELAGGHISAGNVTIALADGIYSITEPLNITQNETSREEGYVLTLRGGENTVISGGISVTGWEKHEGNIWKAAVPDLEQVNGFYVDGEPMALARTEIQGSFMDENGECGIALNTRETYTDFSSYNTFAQIVRCAFTIEKNDGFSFDSLCADLNHIRMYFDQTFSRTCFSFDQAIEGGDTITLLSSELTLQMLNGAKMADYDLSANRYYLANSYLFLDTEGEYYFDTEEKTLYYCSASSPEGKDCIVPICQGLLNIQGTDAKLASNIRLENLTFAYGTTSFLFRDAYKEVISDHYVIGQDDGFERCLLPAQITLDHASNVTVEHCRFVNYDTSGIALREHVYNTAITDCVIRNINGSGVVVGTINMKNGYGIVDRNPHPEDLGHVYAVKKNSVVPAKINISNNLVENCGIESIGSSGIVVYYGYSVNVRNNTVQKTGGSGISAGWGFANYTVKKEATQNSGDIRIEANRVISTCMRIPNAGGIYSMGAFFGSGLTVSGNFVDMTGAVWEKTPAIYLDDGSEYVTVTNNLSVGTDRWLCARALPVTQRDGICIPGEPEGTTLMNCTVSGNFSDRENQQKEFAAGILWPYATAVGNSNVVIENNAVTEDWENHSAAMEIYSNSGAK